MTALALPVAWVGPTPCAVHFALRRVERAVTPREAAYWTMRAEDLRRDLHLTTPYRERLRRDQERFRSDSERLAGAVAQLRRRTREAAARERWVAARESVRRLRGAGTDLDALRAGTAEVARDAERLRESWRGVESPPDRLRKGVNATLRAAEAALAEARDAAQLAEQRARNEAEQRRWLEALSPPAPPPARVSQALRRFADSVVRGTRRRLEDAGFPGAGVRTVAKAAEDCMEGVSASVLGRFRRQTPPPRSFLQLYWLLEDPPRGNRALSAAAALRDTTLEVARGVIGAACTRYAHLSIAMAMDDATRASVLLASVYRTVLEEMDAPRPWWTTVFARQARADELAGAARHGTLPVLPEGGRVVLREHLTDFIGAVARMRLVALLYQVSGDGEAVCVLLVANGKVSVSRALKWGPAPLTDHITESAAPCIDMSSVEDCFCTTRPPLEDWRTGFPRCRGE